MNSPVDPIKYGMMGIFAVFSIAACLVVAGLANMLGRAVGIADLHRGFLLGMLVTFWLCYTWSLLKVMNEEGKEELE